VLKSHPAVREAVAFVVHPVVKAAVLVEEECTATLWTELRRICHARLPSFARPADVTPLAQFPLLSTGKVDRRALQRQLAEG
jgi:acyl-CoA synthetase (AMP-forming)/AMP-acid ligase II